MHYCTFCPEHCQTTNQHQQCYKHAKHIIQAHTASAYAVLMRARSACCPHARRGRDAARQSWLHLSAAGTEWWDLHAHSASAARSYAARHLTLAPNRREHSDSCVWGSELMLMKNSALAVSASR